MAVLLGEAIPAAPQYLEQQQCLSGIQPSIRAAASSIYKEYGALGFWRGSFATILRVAPGTGIYFAALGPMMGTWGAVAPLLKALPLERLTNTPVELDRNVVPAWYLGVISGVARGAAVAIFNPISIVKTRMESSLGPGGMMQAFIQLLRNERPLDWFRGTMATICRDFPFSGLFFVVYVNLKSHMGVEADSRERVSYYALQNFGCGAVAAATASAITHPFDVLRTRLQLDGVATAVTMPSTAVNSSIQGNHRQGTPQRGLLRRVAQLARDEGPGVLWRGLGMRLLKRSLMAALTWTSFEEIKSAISSRP
ncbi:mitochondrial carrier domain-containing protein, putative [Eimeria praecox]|uniref:Mitochondrial carrier domain-containing protein, putative n=1 Tax=Eimeria praecox TaxID=51316 RepID=U6GNJ9_9EIME|nr:mitochondrial carrier domain-containing protein, putative [Eimeria praecox]